jgi:hypothetical protein
MVQESTRIDAPSEPRSATAAVKEAEHGAASGRGDAQGQSVWLAAIRQQKVSAEAKEQRE